MIGTETGQVLIVWWLIAQKHVSNEVINWASLVKMTALFVLYVWTT